MDGQEPGLSEMSLTMVSEDGSDAPDSQQSSVSSSPFEDVALHSQVLDAPMPFDPVTLQHVPIGPSGRQVGVCQDRKGCAVGLGCRAEAPATADSGGSGANGHVAAMFLGEAIELEFVFRVCYFLRGIIGRLRSCAEPVQALHLAPARTLRKWGWLSCSLRSTRPRMNWNVDIACKSCHESPLDALGGGGGGVGFGV